MTPDRRAYYLNVVLGILSALVVGAVAGSSIGMTKASFLAGLLAPLGMGFVASFWWGRARLKSRDWIIVVPITYLLHCAATIPRLAGEVRTSTGIIYLIMIPIFIPLIALGVMLGNWVFGRRGRGALDAGSAGEPLDH